MNSRPRSSLASGIPVSILLVISLGLLLLTGCSPAFNAIPGPPFVYEDFGPESVATRLLGPKGSDTQVIARFGSTQVSPPPTGPDVRYVNVPQAMNFLRSTVRKLPNTSANAALHQRLSHTYDRLYQQYSTKRNAFLSAPSASYGRGGMNRALMMPPMPPAI